MQRFVHAATFIVLVLGSAWCNATSGSVDALAGNLLHLAGMTNGLCAMNTAGDLVYAVGRQSGCVVVGHEADPAQLQLARMTAEATGVLGRTVYLAQGSATNMVLAEEYANVVLIADLTDSQLDASLRTELTRVLAWYGGKAVIGHAADAAGTLSETALSNWLAQFPPANFHGAISNDAFGLWAVLTKGALPGGDDWGHWYHEPDNNPMSRDTAIAAPYFLKWLGKRYQETPFEIHVCAGGRLFSANAGTDRRPGGEPMEFVARSAQNGCVLWKRSLPSGFGEQSSLVIATAPRVYVALLTNVLCLDAASGATLAQINLFTQQMRVTWIALSGEMLLGLGRTIQGSVTNSEIAAYHTVSNALMWRYPYASHIDPRLTAVAGGKLFFYTGERWAGCLDISSGAQKWLVPDTTPPSGAFWVFRNYASSICTSNGFYVFPAENSKMVAFAATDGHILWQTNRFSDWWLLVDGKMRTTGSAAFDPLTGAGSTVPSFGGSICGHYTGSPEAFYSQLGRSFDRKKNASVLRVGDNNGLLKSGCGSCTYAANGVYLSFPQPCWCNHQGRGYIAQCAESNAMALARDRGPRLETGQDGTSIANPLAVDNIDWWTYRANNQRSASTRMTVPTSARLLWQAVPRTLYRTFPTDVGTDDAEEAPSPAVTAGVQLFFGGSDGIVRCLNVGTGTQVWMFATGGRIFAAPTVWDGRVYVGSSDGYAYCLDANTGRLLWRFRASATLRSIMVYGNLMNAWPVNTGITIHNGAAYFSAGILDHHDVFAYAVDAYSGASLRQWPDIGNWNTLQHRGAANYGYMAVVTNRVWMRGGNAPLAIFNAVTGIVTQHISLAEWMLSWMGGAKRFGYEANRGREIGLIANRFMIFGGRLLYADQSERYMGWQGGRYTFVGIDAQGNARLPEVPALNGCALAPAWDDTHFVLARSGNNNNLECWDTASVTSFLDTAIEANKSNPATPYYVATNIPTGVRVWGPQAKEMNAIALAGNAVIVTYTKGSPAYAYWYVTALNRTNGVALWEFQLPTEPLFGGITIDRNGIVIVVLRDGRVVAYGDSSLRIVTPALLPMAGVNTPYTHTLQAIGGTAPYTWTRQTGTLPDGLNMASNGVISGTATLIQTNTFSARVQDAALAETAQAFTLQVMPEPAVLLAPLFVMLAVRRSGIGR